MNESAINKVKKLLETKGRTPEEAATALALAQKILLKEGLTIEDVNSAEADSEIVEYRFEKSEGVVTISLVDTIATHFRVKSLISTRGRSHTPFVIGKKQDVEGFKLCYEYAKQTLDALSKQFLKDYNTGNRHRNLLMMSSYRAGFIMGVEEALKSNEMRWGLIPVVAVEVQQKANDLTKGGVFNVRVRNSNLEAYSFGVEDGREAIKARRLQ